MIIGIVLIAVTFTVSSTVGTTNIGLMKSFATEELSKVYGEFKDENVRRIPGYDATDAEIMKVNNMDEAVLKSEGEKKAKESRFGTSIGIEGRSTDFDFTTRTWSDLVKAFNELTGMHCEMGNGPKQRLYVLRKTVIKGHDADVVKRICEKPALPPLSLSASRGKLGGALSKTDGELDQDCEASLWKKCSLLGDKCVKKMGDACVNSERTFVCGKDDGYEEEKVELLSDGKEVGVRELVCSDICIDGDCEVVSKAKIEENNEIIHAVSTLNALKDARKSVSNDGLLPLFAGRKEFCDKNRSDKMNCCQINNRIKTLDSNCGIDAQNLVKERTQRKCVEVGKYSVHDMRDIERTVFCCYDSVLAKIIAQEAKRQLKITNGSPEAPHCNGLLLKDLERIDLSGTDFSEFFDYVLLPQMNLNSSDFVMQHFVQSNGGRR